MTNICGEQICCLSFHHRAKRHCLCLCKHACILLKFCAKQSMQIQDWQTQSDGRTDIGYLDKHIIFVFNMLVTITSGYQSAANNMTTHTHTHTHTCIQSPPTHKHRDRQTRMSLSFVAVFSLRSEYWNINFESIVQFPIAFLLFALFTRMCSTMRLLHSCLSIAMRNEYQLQLHYLHESGSDKYFA